MKNNKTNDKIENALLSLLQVKDINQVTIKEIAQKANVNRVTIYRHYNDKWDILEKIEEKFLHKLDVPHSKMILNLQLKTQSTTESPDLTALTDFFKVFQENFSLLHILMGTNANLGFTNKLMTYLINLEIKSHPYTLLHMPKDKQEMFSYYSISALIGVIQYWRKHPKYSALQIANFFFKARVGAIKELEDNNLSL